MSPDAEKELYRTAAAAILDGWLREVLADDADHVPHQSGSEDEDDEDARVQDNESVSMDDDLASQVMKRLDRESLASPLSHRHVQSKTTLNASRVHQSSSKEDLERDLSDPTKDIQEVLLIGEKMKKERRRKEAILLLNSLDFTEGMVLRLLSLSFYFFGGLAFSLLKLFNSMFYLRCGQL